MTSTMIPLLYTHIKLRGYAFRCAKIWWYFAHFLHTHAQSVRTQQWLIVVIIASIVYRDRWWGGTLLALGAILIVYIPIRQCARDLICDLMIREVLVHRILQVHSHDPASPRILLLSRNTSRSSKIRGDAGDKMRGDTRCPVETRSLWLLQGLNLTLFSENCLIWLLWKASCEVVTITLLNSIITFHSS